MTVTAGYHSPLGFLNKTEPETKQLRFSFMFLRIIGRRLHRFSGRQPHQAYEHPAETEVWSAGVTWLHLHRIDQQAVTPQS